ncbi:MAG: ATP-dependent metallopeptidase FtsH/Yme1/Tma family protein, partial [Actinomycetota bacterium]
MRIPQPGSPGRVSLAQGRRWLLPLGGMITVFALLALSTGAPRGAALSYSRFQADVNAGAVRAVTISPAGQIAGSLASGQRFTTTIPVALDDRTLAGRLAAHHVQVTAAPAGPSGASPEIVLPSLLLIGGEPVKIGIALVCVTLGVLTLAVALEGYLFSAVSLPVRAVLLILALGLLFQTGPVRWAFGLAVIVLAGMAFWRRGTANRSAV